MLMFATYVCHLCSVLETRICDCVATFRQCGNVVNLDTNFRRGYAHQNWDAMDAWDITVDLKEVRAACETMHMVVLKLAYFNPLPGAHYLKVALD